MAKNTSEKNSSYISAKESRKITKFNRKVTKKLENERNDARKDPSLYTTKMHDENNVVEFDNVCTYFFTDVGTVKAVDGISFEIPKCSTVGVVGESGCGKSVTSLSLMQLLQRPSGQTVGGEIRFNLGDGTAYNIVNTPTSKMQEIRGNKVSMIFQEPMTSLNPVFKIGAQVNEVLELHHPEMNETQRQERTLQMLEMVGIANKEGVYEMYPHELSGGMRQRVMIAIALACNPELIIADEPTTALDVTIQAQMLGLISELRTKMNTAMILITHDLGVVAQTCEKVMVMYAGEAIEYGSAEDIFETKDRHPYTQGLFNAIPSLDSRTDRLEAIEGLMADPTVKIRGCRFASRCKYATPACSEVKQDMREVSPGHFIRCSRFDKKAAADE